MDINNSALVLGMLMSLWVVGFGAGAGLRMFKNVIERASRP